MARPRKPTGLHMIDGTYRPDRHTKRGAVVPADSLGDVPIWFNARMKVEWKRITEDSTLRQILNHAHRPTVIHHCVLNERFEQDAQGKRAMTSSERQTFHSIQMQLGWTPSSQARVHYPEKPQASNPFLALG